MSLHAITNRLPCSAFKGERTITIALLRHAQAGLHGRFCGHSDPGLSAEGQEQLPGIVKAVSRFALSAIWSSDLRRAQETAAPIARHFGMDYMTSPCFREMNFGLWEGLAWEEVEREYPDDAQAWIKHFPRHRPSQGESFAELQTRATRQLELLGESVNPGCTLVVTHAGFIRATVAWILGMPEDRISHIGQNHGASTILERVGNHWSVSALNGNLFSLGDAKSEGVEGQV
jgi:alpha-ribazole phosphatase